MLIVAHFQALIADNYGILALFPVLIADSFGIFTLLQVLIADFFLYLSLFQELIADNYGIFNTLGKNKHHTGLEPMTSSITSLNCSTNSMSLVHIKRCTTRNTGDMRQDKCDWRRETGYM